MSTEQMVAMVLLITQLIKEWIREKNIFPGVNIKSWFVVLISFLTSIGVVIYNTLEKLHEPLTFGIILTIIFVFGYANAGKKLLNIFKPK